MKSSIVVMTVDAAKGSSAWKSKVAAAAKIAMREKSLRTIDLMTEGYKDATPLKFICRFYLKRPSTHFRSGKNAALRKDDSPDYPTTPADLLKLARAAEDACAGTVFKDDSAIVTESLTKRFSGEDFLLVEVWIVE
jgi:Holliday junction resolvase RusA-like endonuclease